MWVTVPVFGLSIAYVLQVWVVVIFELVKFTSEKNSEINARNGGNIGAVTKFGALQLIRKEMAAFYLLRPNGNNPSSER